MMLKLLLLRHAKSDWGRPGLSDHDRPLNARGRRAAPDMGTWIAREGLTPDLALVSSAARAQETWRLSGLDAAMETQSALYHAEPQTILAAAQSGPSEVRTLMIVGHQPGMQAAANMFLSEGKVDDYPTAKLTVIGFDVEAWAKVRFGAGRLLLEMAPKRLPD